VLAAGLAGLAPPLAAAQPLTTQSVRVDILSVDSVHTGTQ